MAASPVAASIDMGWDGADYYDNYKDEAGNSLMLDSNYNLIMLMMETGEYNAINPVLTPNLEQLKEMSTWVDGYYSTERTCFTEYASLTGSYAMGNEMWRDYPNTDVTQSLGSVFRRAYEAKGTPYQIGGFHTYDAEFYGRENMFTPDHYGFDFIRDISDPRYGGNTINKAFNTNSDYTMFDTMQEDIAPSDGTSFLSWVLGVSTHCPHFNSENVWYNKDGQIESSFPESLAEITEPETYQALEDLYPKLKNGDATEKLACMSFLVGIREYDRGIGVLLDHLRGNNANGVDLLKNTAIVLYSDHYDYM